MSLNSLLILPEGQLGHIFAAKHSRLFGTNQGHKSLCLGPAIMESPVGGVPCSGQEAVVHPGREHLFLTVLGLCAFKSQAHQQQSFT